MSTPNQKKVLDIIQKQVQKGTKISVTKAMRESGVYSESTAKRPEKITKSKGFIKILEAAGLTDSFLAKKHSQLSRATRLEKDTFYAQPKIEIKRKKEHIVAWIHVSDEKIKEMIEGAEDDPTGNRVAYIKKFEKYKEVYFRVPDSVVQSKALEMGYKIKDHFAPNKLDIIDHDLSEKELEAMGKLFSKK